MRLQYVFFCLLFVVLQSTELVAQVPRDTSFTIYSTYLKERKYRPYIKVAEVEANANVNLSADLAYTNTGSRNLLLDIYYPTNTASLKPAVLLIFGGGWRSGSKEQNKAMSTALANHGYVAVSPEYRLSLEATYPAAVHDLKNAVKWMKANASSYGIDSNKITVLGCSAGGQLAALLGTTNGDLSFESAVHSIKQTSDVQAVIDIDGTLAFHHPESVEGSAAALWLGGTYAEKPEVWEQAAPLNHVGKNTPAFLFLNSSLPRFHAGRTDFIHKTDSLGIYTEVHEFPDTPHPFWFFEPWFEPMMERIYAFLERQFGKP